MGFSIYVKNGGEPAAVAPTLSLRTEATPRSPSSFVAGYFTVNTNIFSCQNSLLNDLPRRH